MCKELGRCGDEVEMRFWEGIKKDHEELKGGRERERGQREEQRGGEGEDGEGS